jgi:hypothetical protein
LHQAAWLVSTTNSLLYVCPFIVTISTSSAKDNYNMPPQGCQYRITPFSDGELLLKIRRFAYGLEIAKSLV